MSPQEKAKELLDIMSSQTYTYQPYAGSHCNVEEIGWEAGKKCVLIAVDEIISELSKEWGAPYLFEEATQNDWGEKRMKFWEEVKTEIERL